MRPLFAPDQWESHGTDARALYQRYGGDLHAFCLRKLGDREEAADVVQDTFLNAWLALRRGVEPETPYAWLLTIARNLCVSRHRARGARIQAVHLDEAHHQTPARQSQAEELIELGPMLRRLPERQRRAFLLHEIKGLSYGEVAAELKLSYSAVATLIFRARQSLAQSLAQSDIAEERPRRALGMSLLGFLEPLIRGGAPVKIAAALIATPLVLLPSSGPPRAWNQAPSRSPAVAVTPGSPAPLGEAVAAPPAPALPVRRQPGSGAGGPVALAVAQDEAAVVSPARAGIPSAGGSRGPASPDDVTPAPAAPSAAPAPSPSASASPPTAAAGSPGSGRPAVATASPGSRGQGQGNGPPADPGSQGQGSGPPADPGSQGQGNGPPADPGSQGQGNGPPADPGSQGHGPPPR